MNRIPTPSFHQPACRRALGLVLGATLSALAIGAQAADGEVLIVLKDHRFTPAEVKVPAGERIKLVIHNQDATAEEFESKSMKREKMIPAGAKVPVMVGPLKPGRYDFYGEFNEALARGVIVAE